MCNRPGCGILGWLFKSCLNAPGQRGILSLGDARQETSLGVGLLKKIVASKKEFIGRSYENCYFQCRNSAVYLQLRRRWHSNSTWNWFHVFRYKRLFSFCYWRGILSTPSSFSSGRSIQEGQFSFPEVGAPYNHGSKQELHEWQHGAVMIGSTHHLTLELVTGIHPRNVWFGLVLWHINHCRSFNANSFL